MGSPEFKKSCDSFGRVFVCNIVVQFGVTKKLAGLTKMLLNESYGKVRIVRSYLICFLIRVV